MPEKWDNYSKNKKITHYAHIELVWHKYYIAKFVKYQDYFTKTATFCPKKKFRSSVVALTTFFNCDNIYL